jgi:hypothetical protein
MFRDQVDAAKQLDLQEQSVNVALLADELAVTVAVHMGTANTLSPQQQARALIYSARYIRNRTMYNLSWFFLTCSGLLGGILSKNGLFAFSKRPSVCSRKYLVRFP